MGFAVRVYEAFRDDEVKAKVLAEFIAKVEEAISNNQVATRQDLGLQELKHTKEIKKLNPSILHILYFKHLGKKNFKYVSCKFLDKL
jgi:hypothetical protein